ncbi:MAG: amino acid adenylation domain-containing protein, partial [Candidatus Eremiobacteraeota bacterium]|nr:amino acid adenylation domain-containing protein [Candidatus Eremiobacteraeota bacterium]
VDGRPIQVVDLPPSRVLRSIEATGFDVETRESEARRIVAERARAPFDLAEEHPFRATLVRVDELEHLLLLEAHHIACDGWSLALIQRQLTTIYRATLAGVDAKLARPALQYADYAVWQRETIANAALERLLAYWRAQLGDGLEPLDLPTDFPRGAPTFSGVRRSLEMAPDFSARLKSVALATGATPHMIVLAAFATVLHRYTGRQSVVIGSNVAARSESDLDDVVGYFNKTLPMRIDFAGDPTFEELLVRVRATCLGAYDHQEIPIEQLGLELKSLFDVVLTAQLEAPSPFALEGVRVEPYGVDLGATKFDLTLFTSDAGGSLRLMLRARSELWRSESAERWLGHVGAALLAAVTDPSLRTDSLPILTEAERRELAAWNATDVDSGTSTVAALIDAVVARSPQGVALVCGDERVTYEELAQRADRLAARLFDAGIRADDVVGLLLERSVDALVAVLAIWRAGAAYAPMGCDAPPLRIAEQLEAIACRHVVTNGAAARLAPAGVRAILVDGDDAPFVVSPLPLPASLDAASLAYVLFTSGTSGVPKAVGVTHANLANYVRAMSRVFADVPATASDESSHADLRFATVSTFAADLGNTAIFPALCAGGTLHVVPFDVATDAARFATYVRAERIDVLKITPSHMQALLAATLASERATLLPARWLVLGGERFGWELAEMLEAARAGSACRILNHYGPTETTVGALTFELTAASADAARALGAQSVPVGRPLANLSAHVCDANGGTLPVGIPGELRLAGAGVSRGYLNDPELTARRFVPFAGYGRAYRTGDRVRRLPTGDIEFIERTDTQVKLRGFRIELGDVERALATLPGVAQVAVVLRADEAGAEPALVAFVVAHLGA